MPYYTMLEIVKGLGTNVAEGGWQMLARENIETVPEPALTSS